MDDRLVGLIAESHVTEFDVAAHGPGVAGRIVAEQLRTLRSRHTGGGIRASAAMRQLAAVRPCRARSGISHAEFGLGRFRIHLRLFEEAEHALGGGRASLQVLEGLRELRQRLGEQADVHHERDDHAEFDLPVHGERRTDHAHDHVAEVADEVHQRHHQA